MKEETKSKLVVAIIATICFSGGLILGLICEDNDTTESNNSMVRVQDDVLVLGEIQTFSVPDSFKGDCFVIVSSTSNLPYFLYYDDDYIYGDDSFIIFNYDDTVETFYVGDIVYCYGDLEVFIDGTIHTILRLHQLDLDNFILGV